MKYLSYLIHTLLSKATSLFHYIKGVKFGNKTIFNGISVVHIVKGARITIGDNCLLNSRNTNYHLNMHSSCKLMADRESAQIIIGNRTRIHGTCIHAYNSITIGNNCLIAANCQIIDGNGHSLSFDDVANRIFTTDNGKPIIIEDNVWIGANSIILGGSTIGYGTVVSAGSIVKGSLLPMSLYGGNPAKLIKSYI